MEVPTSTEGPTLMEGPTFRSAPKGRRRQPATAPTVGVVEHGNSAVLVTVAPGGRLLDRHRIDLTDRGLPTHPHHHEGSWAVGRYRRTPGARALSLALAVALVERVRESAARGAHASLDALVAAMPVPIAGMAIRACARRFRRRSRGPPGGARRGRDGPDSREMSASSWTTHARCPVRSGDGSPFVFRVQ